MPAIPLTSIYFLTYLCGEFINSQFKPNLIILEDGYAKKVVYIYIFKRMTNRVVFLSKEAP